ncbi:alcohol dehydrogenase [Mycena vulgaris]|nr:alcohol dehydrogenase [Mycena vulgaris]
MHTLSTTQTIDLETVPLNGGFLIKTLVLSVDPYFRGGIRRNRKSYISGFQISVPLDGFGVGVVLRSENPAVEVGKYIYGYTIRIHSVSRAQDARYVLSSLDEADVAFNYKTTDTRAVLEKEGPIDVLWDNVGGDVLDAALEFAADHARFLECGSISEYNLTTKPGIQNFSLIVAKSLRVYGIFIGHLIQKYYTEFYSTIPVKLASGEIKYSEEISKGLDKVGDVILAVQNGTNKAKAVVVVAEE